MDIGQSLILFTRGECKSQNHMATKLPWRPDGVLNGSQQPNGDKIEPFWTPWGKYGYLERHQVAKAIWFWHLHSPLVQHFTCLAKTWQWRNENNQRKIQEIYQCLLALGVAFAFDILNAWVDNFNRAWKKFINFQAIFHPKTKAFLQWLGCLL